MRDLGFLVASIALSRAEPVGRYAARGHRMPPKRTWLSFNEAAMVAVVGRFEVGEALDLAKRKAFGRFFAGEQDAIE